jgi:hypothetical protein
MTTLTIEDMGEAIGTVIGEVRDEIRDELTTRIANLESKVAIMQAHELKWVGTWNKSLAVPIHGLVTHKGSLWLKVSEADTGGPGTSVDYKLIVKQGRVGR